jgi:alkylation response protein AidB-like acyl-CoA dehydrogenase
MDFSFTEAQAAVTDLAKKIFAERVTPASLKAVEADGSLFDRKLWADLAAAGLLATAVPESEGGSGHGMRELCALLVEAGAAVAPVPLWPVLVLGALPIAALGTEAQKRRWLPGVASGETLLTAALSEENALDATQPKTLAARAGTRWSLEGTKICVPLADLAARILVPARTSDGAVGVFLVDPRAPGVGLAREIATTGEPQFRVGLARVEIEDADVLVPPAAGSAALTSIVDRATLGLCALELGVAERALRMTAAYTSSRKQFDRPIATFQAVSQRAADAYIDVEAIRLTLWKAAYMMDAGLRATDAVATAKLWAAEAGHRVVYAAQHLHGGIGFDRDYPLHRHYLWSKQIELTLGPASVQLAKLGASLARAESAS